MEELKPASFAIQREGGVYTVRAAVQANPAGSARVRLVQKILGYDTPKHDTEHVIELSYSKSEIETLEASGIARRAAVEGLPDPRSPSQILRAVGTFLDLFQASSLRDIVFQDGWVAVGYESAEGRAEQEKQDLDYFYDFWVKMYLRRKRPGVAARASEPTLYVKWEREIKRLKD